MGRRRASTRRPRGGASHACPKCGGRTEVVDTRRSEDGPGVRRVRQCVRVGCRRRFTTAEEVSA
jgi:transcriptional regulator NrdR family protein